MYIEKDFYTIILYRFELRKLLNITHIKDFSDALESDQYQSLLVSWYQLVLSTSDVM